jgi:serine/threonine protein kinase
MSDEAKDPLIGQTLGAYLLVEPLGRGGMATVYKAHEAALDRYVAVKILPQFLASNDDFIQRFRREAKAIAQLNHPNIVPVYSYGEEGNIIYIAMQLVEGGALKREDGQVFAAKEALKALAPIARALDYAHKRGIIHRDIKPGNILLSHGDWPMLADFGLARIAEASQHLTASGVSMGTPLYMSPEQGKGTSVDHRTDIYSLGIVLFELLTGKAPFIADTPMGTIVKHITEPLPMPRQVNPNIPKDVENIILKAAAKELDERFQSAGEMAEAMENALNALTNPARAAANSRTGSEAAAKSREKTRLENPFTFGNPIKEPSRFFGRQTEIRQIVNRLLSSAHESTSIIGERRIGKTSLLNHLANPEVAAGLGLTSDKFCIVYMDFQGLTDITPTRFWQRVLNKASRSLSGPQLAAAFKKMSQSEKFDLFDLEDLFTEIVDRGLTIVLCMDEFEYITQNPNFGSEFFGGLRALAIHDNLTLLPATRRELVDLCHSDELKGSPFFNIFANVVLRPFQTEEVGELLTSYMGSEKFSFSPEVKKFIYHLAGGYPIFVQMAGYYTWEALSQGMEGEHLEKFAAENFYQQAEPHFSYMWSHCSESEKITLLVLQTLSSQKLNKKTTPTLENLSKMRARASQDVATLEKRGLILEEENKYSIFSPGFMQWVRHEILAVPGEEETEANAIEWLKSGGQQNVKDANKALPQFKKKYWHVISECLSEFTAKLAVESALELVKMM